MYWLVLFSQFEMTIHHVPGKSNVIANASLYHPDLAAVVVLVESGLFTWICDA